MRQGVLFGETTGLGLPALTWTNVGLGLLALAAAVVLGQVLRHTVKAFLQWRGRSEGSATVFGRLVGWVMVAVGVAAMLTIVFPSVQPVNILGGVGIISIAAGIAFQTVLGNMFAGIVILARDRFKVGDQIAVAQVSGNVVQMGLSSTSLRTFDGKLVVVPNSVLHSELVTVQTGFEHVRSSIMVDLDVTADLDRAREVALAAMADLPEVYADPAPQAFLTEIGTGTVSMELRFCPVPGGWTPGPRSTRSSGRC
ncbi:mechanosensitive ion channel family protein [Ornithinimicrobium sp. Y1847]|uniref:mechanosensitive ion channel family protein n=1 Tax=unclassified Ornithinimicrobium TaxID=2615080 RepID=UPI003B678FC0